MSSFVELLDRVRAADQEAAAELVRQFEPDIRRAVRIRLSDPSLRQVVDSTDICQSVLARFFWRLASENYALREADDLRRLLTVMVRNRIIDWLRREYSARRRRDKRTSLDDGHLNNCAAPSRTNPSRIAEMRDELHGLYRQLDDDLARTARCRAAGMTWAEIGAAEGEDPDTLRVRLFRALAKRPREA